jgi:predicted enzyme related to lactoylglutathione lyase
MVVMGDPVTWFDLGAAEEGPLKAFYAELFGWKLQPAAETYTMVSTGGGIPGGIGHSQTGDPWVAFYVSVADPQATLDRAVSLGGSVVVPVTEIPDVVTFAMFDDPDGLLIGLMKAPSAGETAPPSAGEGAAVDWFEILGSDGRRSQAFYGELFGWSFKDAMTDYALVDTGAGSGISGGVGASGNGRRWATVYASVDDVERSLARAEELGGRREYGPLDVDDHMQTGAVRDPAGNVFGVYHHAPH